MDLSVTPAPGKPAAAVVGLVGDLDASNYIQVIERVDRLYREGTRTLILDLSQVDFVSSSGLLAIHSMALLMQGLRPPNPQDGWGAIREIKQGTSAEAREHLKLVNPRPRVAAILEKVGMSDGFEIYPTVDAALAGL